MFSQVPAAIIVTLMVWFICGSFIFMITGQGFKNGWKNLFKHWKW